jgi:hypothetical protein
MDRFGFFSLLHREGDVAELFRLLQLFDPGFPVSPQGLVDVAEISD